MRDKFPDTDLVLLTRGRVDEQVLLTGLHDSIRREVIIVCHKGEKKAHQINWGGRVKDIIEYSGSNVGEARQWCVDNLDKKNIIFLEDNINLHVRADKPDFGNVRKFGLYEMSGNYFHEERVVEFQTNMINDITEKLNSGDYGLVGISQRYGNNRFEEDFVENVRIFGLFGLNRKLYKSLGHKMSDVKYREDFYIILRFLLMGIKVGMFAKYALNKKHGVNSPGGCNTYRTPEETNRNVMWMVEQFPGIVSPKENKKVTWKGYNGITLDVIVQWKKAYEIGVGKREMPTEPYKQKQKKKSSWSFVVDDDVVANELEDYLEELVVVCEYFDCDVEDLLCCKKSSGVKYKRETMIDGEELGLGEFLFSTTRYEEV